MAVIIIDNPMNECFYRSSDTIWRPSVNYKHQLYPAICRLAAKTNVTCDCFILLHNTILQLKIAF